MRALRLCLAPGGFLRTRLNRFKTSAYMENVLFGTYKKGDLGVLRHAPGSLAYRGTGRQITPTDDDAVTLSFQFQGGCRKDDGSLACAIWEPSPDRVT